MSLLRDKQLYDLVTSDNPILSGWLKKDISCEHLDSPIQPCSIDLHVGEIFCPSVDSQKESKTPTPLRKHILKPGATAVVTTLETLAIPPALAIIGFPPARISGQGILTTNPGHVDPGYQGKMHLTMINMGRQEYELRQGDPVITLLVFNLGENVGVDYQTRFERDAQARKPSIKASDEENSGSKSGTPDREQKYIAGILENLAPHFMNYEVRAQEVAKEVTRNEIQNEKDKISGQVFLTQIIGAILSIIAIIAGVLLTAANSSLDTRLKGLEDKLATQSKIEELDKRIEAVKLEEKIVKLEEQLKLLQQSINVK